MARPYYNFNLLLRTGYQQRGHLLGQGKGRQQQKLGLWVRCYSLDRRPAAGKGDRGSSKVFASADEAVADVRDGDTILSAGFGLCGVAGMFICLFCSLFFCGVERKSEVK